MNELRELKVAIIGFGNRGKLFNEIVKGTPTLLAKVVAVVEPRQVRRDLAKELTGLPDNMIFDNLDDFLKLGKIADAAFVMTMDKDHIHQAVPLMKAGYNILLEKPMSVSLDECREIAKVRRETGVLASVCHSLRHNNFYSYIKRVIDSGRIGRVMNIDQIEGIGDIHFSSSFIRGNWGVESKSSFILMTKCCHDVDLIGYLLGKKCVKTSSFGNLSYFKPEFAPKDAPMRCMDGCPHINECQYNCLKVYLRDGWSIVLPKSDEASIIEELKTGPYGRCIWHCDNDVCDHQVVAMEFEGGETATLTLTAFHYGNRIMRVNGTKGCLECNLLTNTVVINEFDHRTTETAVIPPAGAIGHGGGDFLVIQNFFEAIRKNDPSIILTDIDESLASHKVVFAAEKARRESRVVNVSELD